MKIEGLSELLESVKEEVETWTLDPMPDNPEQIRRGLYLTALDILLAETREPGGYESYSHLPDRVILPRQEYEMFRQQLYPYIALFMQMWLTRTLDPEVLSPPSDNSPIDSSHVESFLADLDALS